MTFTQEDAKNDGKIKAEAGPSMKQVAARENSELYEYYKKVCSNMGVDPGVDLADLAVRALEDESFADRVLNTQVDLRKIKANEIRIQDMKQVKQYYEEFNNDSGPAIDIESIIEQRLQQTASGPLSGPRGGPLGADRGRESGSNPEVDQLRQEVRRLQSELEEERRKKEQDAGGASSNPAGTQNEDHTQSPGTGGVSATNEDEVDGLFSEDDSGNESATVTEITIDDDGTGEGGGSDGGDNPDSSGATGNSETPDNPTQEGESEIDDTPSDSVGDSDVYTDSGSSGESEDMVNEIEDEFDSEEEDNEQ